MFLEITVNYYRKLEGFISSYYTKQICLKEWSVCIEWQRIEKCVCVCVVGREGERKSGNCTKHNTSPSFCESEGLGNIYRVS